MSSGFHTNECNDANFRKWEQKPNGNWREVNEDAVILRMRRIIALARSVIAEMEQGKTS